MPYPVRIDSESGRCLEVRLDDALELDSQLGERFRLGADVDLWRMRDPPDCAVRRGLFGDLDPGDFVHPAVVRASACRSSRKDRP